MLQFDVKAKYRLISRTSSGMKSFLTRAFAELKATRVCVRSINRLNRSLSVRLFYLFCSSVFISSRSYENRSMYSMATGYKNKHTLFDVYSIAAGHKNEDTTLLLYEFITSIIPH